MENLPKRKLSPLEAYPQLGVVYGQLADAVANAGSLDRKTCALIRMCIAIGAGLEGASKTQARVALENGATADELRHAALQSTTLIGFPSMIKSYSWIEEVALKREGASQPD
jgi:alkylhydroperoxidase/carboxymuconolactone decarboxylase family protein YurZ